MEKVIAQLALDHLRLKRIIKSLEHPVERYLRGNGAATPDLDIIKKVVEYASVRGDQYHHLLEETLLLKLEAQITDQELLQLFDTIRQQHEQLDDLAKIIRGYFAALDTANAVPATEIITAYSEYAAMQLEHMETEDAYFYPMVEQLFSNDELELIQVRFGLREDPLFGEKPEKSFKRLFDFVIAWET